MARHRAPRDRTHWLLGKRRQATSPATTTPPSTVQSAEPAAAPPRPVGAEQQLWLYNPDGRRHEVSFAYGGPVGRFHQRWLATAHSDATVMDGSLIRLPSGASVHVALNSNRRIGALA